MFLLFSKVSELWQETFSGQAHHTLPMLQALEGYSTHKDLGPLSLLSGTEMSKGRFPPKKINTNVFEFSSLVLYP